MTTSKTHRGPSLHEAWPTTRFAAAFSGISAGDDWPLRITVRPGSDRDVVALAGEIDIATAPQLRYTIHRRLTEDHTRILLDLDAVTFLDGAALGALITATREVAQAHGTLQVTRNTRCMRLLAITGETHRLNITDCRNPADDRGLRFAR